MGSCCSVANRDNSRREEERERLLPPAPVMQSSEVSTIAVSGEGKPRRSVRFNRDGQLTGLPSGIANLHENFLNGHRVTDGVGSFLGYRSTPNDKPGPYQWITYQQAYLRIKNLGSGLGQYGARFGTNIAIFSINRTEWVLTEHACYMYGYISVPLYDTLGPEAIEYILSLADVQIVVASLEKTKSLLKIARKLSNLKLIICMDAVPGSVAEEGREYNIEVVTMRQVEATGREMPLNCAQTDSNTIATICFTSGTTGLPKGALLSHGNLLSFVGSVQEMQKEGIVPLFNSQETHISYLPLAHIFERIIQVAVTHSGGKIGFFQGDTLKLMDDIQVLRPTIFPSVPRLYNRIYDKVMDGVKAKGGVAAYLFFKGYERKKELLKEGKYQHFFWDALVFNKIRAKLGGRVKLLVSGAAPLGEHIVEFLRICFSTVFIEGYGQTETTGAACLTEGTDLSSGHVGVPMPSAVIKLRDVPAMNYTSNDLPHPRGEICIKGTCVFKGYYKAPDKTEETLSADGWCFTGDVGLWDSHGRLKIIDRVKNIFKLSQGEYIAPEKVEMVLQRHEAVFQAFVYGDSLQSFLVGVVVVDEIAFIPWARSAGFSETTLSELLARPDISNVLQKSLETFGKSHGLQGFECLKRIYLETEPFTCEGGLLTPTFKLMRNAAKQKYQMQIDQLYAMAASS